MKFIIKTILIISFCFFLQYFFPFWIVALVGFLINLFIRTDGWNSFLSGFVAVFLLWLLLGLTSNKLTDSILTNQVAQIFYMNGILLTLTSALIGGLAAGFGSLTGSMLAQLRTKKRSETYHS